MSTVQPYQEQFASRSVSRSVAKSLATIQAGSTLDVARIEAAVQRRETVTDGITALTARALQHVAMVSQAEQNLAQAVPHASGRLAAIADAHALAMTSVVMDAARALGRLA
jgi:hypothetical protein